MKSSRHRARAAVRTEKTLPSAMSNFTEFVYKRLDGSIANDSIHYGDWEELTNSEKSGSLLCTGGMFVRCKTPF